MLEGERVRLTRVDSRQAPCPKRAPPRVTGRRILILDKTARRVAPRILLWGMRFKTRTVPRTRESGIAESAADDQQAGSTRAQQAHTEPVQLAAGSHRYGGGTSGIHRVSIAGLRP